MKPSELRTKTAEELNQDLREAQEELFRLRFQSAVGKLSNTAQFSKVRRTIARIKTIQRERELAAAYAAQNNARN